MKILTINKNLCPQNHSCPSMRVCPNAALTQQGYKAPEIIQEKCIQCGKCVRYCPMGAFSIIKQ
ncbi:MAG: 4Fe-4S binding protein [Clostridia bacterium]|nr:4Fe-4S binding protein [Clostridia bacterium]